MQTASPSKQLLSYTLRLESRFFLYWFLPVRWKLKQIKNHNGLKLCVKYKSFPLQSYHVYNKTREPMDRIVPLVTRLLRIGT